jgi:hypothetical protein
VYVAAPRPDAEDWQELAERLLHHPYPGGPSSDVQVFFQRLPEEFLTGVPTLNGWRLLGGALHSHGDGRPAFLQAVLDARGSSSELLNAYQSELLADGWSVFEAPRPMHGGFVSGVTGDAGTYRRGGDGPVLMVTVVERKDMPADVRLRLDWELPQRMPRTPHGLPRGAELMPALRPPSGVMLSGQTGGGGDDGWNSNAIAVTDLPVAELESQLSAQLVQAGWTRREGSADEVVAWSSWRVPHEDEWRGLLLVLAAFSPGHRTLMLRIER